MKYLEWLKTQLGEEQFNKFFPAGSDILKTVTEKLGEKKIIEDDGKLIPFTRFEEVNKKLTDPETGLKAVTDKLAKVQGDFDQLKNTKPGDKNQIEQQIADLNKKISDLTSLNELKDKSLLFERKENALENGLVAAKVNPKYLPLIKKQFDLEKSELDEKGEIKGFADLLKPVQENFKDLFGEVKFVGGDPNPGSNPLANVEMSQEDFYSKEVFRQ
jgi:hypothetical protein